MDKFGVSDSDLWDGLRDEEHQVMIKISSLMTRNEKTAQEDNELRSLESRLHQIRDKLTEHDLKGKYQNA